MFEQSRMRKGFASLPKLNVPNETVGPFRKISMTLGDTMGLDKYQATIRRLEMFMSHGIRKYLDRRWLLMLRTIADTTSRAKPQKGTGLLSRSNVLVYSQN